MYHHNSFIPMEGPPKTSLQSEMQAVLNQLSTCGDLSLILYQEFLTNMNKIIWNNSAIKVQDSISPECRSKFIALPPYNVLCLWNVPFIWAMLKQNHDELSFAGGRKLQSIMDMCSSCSLITLTIMSSTLNKNIMKLDHHNLSTVAFSD